VVVEVVGTSTPTKLAAEQAAEGLTVLTMGTLMLSKILVVALLELTVILFTEEAVAQVL
jgi:hypothetical protein